MAQSQMQYSPAQILAAGRRAENDGRREYALQFFQHILDQYPNSPEAGHAREAVARMSSHPSSDAAEARPGLTQSGRPQSDQAFATQAATLPHHQSAQVQQTQFANDPAATTGHTGQAFGAPSAKPNLQQGTPLHQQPPGSPHPRPNPPPQRLSPTGNLTSSNGKLNLEPVAGMDGAERRAMFPEPRLRRHPLGHLFAYLIIAFGAAMIAIGLGLVAGVVIAPNLLGVITGGSSPITGSLTAAAVLIGGVFVTLVGLTARGVFLNARTLHDLAMAEYQRNLQNRR